MNRPVWITGIGVVSAAGLGVAALEQLITQGGSALSRSPDDSRWLGRAPDPPPSAATRRLDRAARLFVAAAEEAWRSAGLEDAMLTRERVAVLEGSSLGPMSEVLGDLRRGRFPCPSALLRCMTGAGGSVFGQLHGITGPVLHLSSGSVSAACAVAQGWERIRSGELDVVVAGGAECPLAEEIIATFAAAGLLAPGDESEPGCRPFDAARAGTVLGEGAGVLVLEAAPHAVRRLARPRAILLRAGTATECGGGMLAPRADGEGILRVVRAVCGMPKARPGWIKSHGTGTRLNDTAEARGLWQAFGPDLAEIPITALKPTLGHTLGASAALEAVASVVALGAGVVPPTHGLTCLDQELGPLRVPTVSTPAPAGPALLLSQSFGGRAAALLIAA
jgi:3-oxoacyl-(acyl-carrier-protein) synthase